MAWSRTVYLALAALPALSACINPRKVEPIPVSPAVYAAMSCDDMLMEQGDLEDRAHDLYWDVYFGKKSKVPAYAELQGRYEALRQASEAKQCGPFLGFDFKEYRPPREKVCEACV